MQIHPDVSAAVFMTKPRTWPGDHGRHPRAPSLLGSPTQNKREAPTQSEGVPLHCSHLRLSMYKFKHSSHLEAGAPESTACAPFQVFSAV